MRFSIFHFPFSIFKTGIIGIFLLLCLTYPSKSFAQVNSYVTVVHPVRGGEYWTLKDQEPVTTVRNAYQIVNDLQIPATWLIRFDALADPKIVNQVKQMNSNQEIGLFLEITEGLTKQAGVTYHKGQTWHNAGSVFLVGYEPKDREKLIDTAVAKFRSVTGKDPKSVGAWWLDAYSLNYLKEKYGVTAAMIVADQFTTDNYQIWGQYWSTPYYPSKVNTLLPAENNDRKLDVVVSQWAARDPYNGYGNGVYDSTYSVQVNDYLPYHDLTIDYFKKLVATYVHPIDNQLGQVTVGLENDFSWAKFGIGYQQQLQFLADQTKSGSLTLASMQDFATVFRSHQNQNSVSVISATNPLGGSGAVVWYQSPYYRVGWFSSDKGSQIRDMRLYFDHNEEPCLKVACDSLNFAFSESKAIDDATNGEDWLIDEGDISNLAVTKLADTVQISYKNKIGNTRTITFKPKDVAIDGKAQSAAEAIIKTLDANEATKGQKIQPTTEPVVAPWGRLIRGSLLFIAFCLFIFYFPGRLIRKIARVADDAPFHVALDITLGIALFTLPSYLFGLLHLSMALLPIYAALTVVMFVNQKLLFPKRDLIKAHILPLVFIVAGSIVISLATIKNGWPQAYGLGFWGPNGHDAIWHLSLIESLIRHLPAENPTFAGSKLVNYHFFFDLFMASIAKLMKINTLDLLFRFVPVLLALLYGALGYTIVYRLTKSQFAGSIAIFFSYFGGSFGWIITHFRSHTFSGETIFWATQAMSFLLNPPFAISVILLLAGIVVLFDWFSKRRLALLLPLVLLLGVIGEFKAYAAVIVIAALGVTAVFELWRERVIKTGLLTLILLLTNGAILLANTKAAQGLLVWSPFWLVNSMIDSPDRLYWPRLSLTRDSGSVVKLVLAEFLGTVLFIVGNLGTRIVGVFAMLKSATYRLSSFIMIFLVSGICVGSAIALLFIQKGTTWNTVQFFYYAIIFMNLFAAVAIWQIYVRFGKIVGIIFFLGLIFLTVPTTNDLLNTYLPNRAPTRLPIGEAKALAFLKDQQGGIVLTYPYYEKVNEMYAEPVPLFAYTTTAYVSAFSAKPVYFEDKMNNEIIGVDSSARLVGNQEIFKNTNPEFDQKFLKDSNIRYIYLPRLLKTHIDEGSYGVTNIYHTQDVNIYKVY